MKVLVDRAFTVVELLVVIAIIALLVSIMMPSIRLARSGAELALCASHQTELANASISYAIANKGKFPDLSLDDVGRIRSSQMYWTLAHWRDHLETSYGVTRQNWYSVSNPWWNRDDFYRWGSTYMVMGRFYFGKNRVMNNPNYARSVRGYTPMGDRSAFAHRLGEIPAFAQLWTDLNRQWPAGQDDFWISPGDPNRVGSNHLNRAINWPRGSHVNYVDGHQEWVKGPDIIYRHSHGAEIYW